MAKAADIGGDVGQDLPYTRQMIDDADIAAVTSVLRSDFLTSGPMVAAFEEALARHSGARHVVACSSGTAALHLTALALGLMPGEAVIVPSITFVATANAARFCGADVVFADIDPETGLMEAEHVADALKRTDKNVRAVYPVHLGGQTCDMKEIGTLAADHDLSVVEDACHALGTVAEIDGRRIVVGDCTYSDMSIFSFHPAKTIAMGEGGAVATNDDAYAERLRDFCNHGIVRDADRFKDRPDTAPGYYEQQMLGYNYRASDLHCALGASQMTKLDTFVATRAALVAAYDAALGGLAPLLTPVRRKNLEQTGWHLYQVLIDFDRAPVQREALMDRLRARGVGTQVHYMPVHCQPYYRETGTQPDLPGADRFYRRCLSLPLFAGMTEQDVERVVSVLKDELTS
jgi:UDP-4-amino-4,6-dideoxy-N-acetyl-beta-L-altrosamine transaminase